MQRVCLVLCKSVLEEANHALHKLHLPDATTWEPGDVTLKMVQLDSATLEGVVVLDLASAISFDTAGLTWKDFLFAVLCFRTLILDPTHYVLCDWL